MSALRRAMTVDGLRWTSLALAVLGAVDAAYLTYIKVANATAFCSNVGDCDTVNNSIYSEVYGVPVAVFGLAGFLAIAGLLALEDRVALLADYGPLAVFGLALTGTLYSAYLTYVELFVIYAICPYCVISALLMTGIFVLSVVRLVRSAHHSAA